MEQNRKDRYDTGWPMHRKQGRKGRIFAGLILLIAGGALLLRNLDLVLLPWWLFTWPMILIAVGLISGVKHGFRGGFWLVFMLLGVLFLFNEIDPTLHLKRFIAPIAIIAVGLTFLLRPKKRRRHPGHGSSYHGDYNYNYAGSEGELANDYIDITSVFGGVKKNVLSKNFRGGELVNFMGGSEINLTQADFNGRIVIDATNIFGGTKLIVPSSWDVQSEVTAIFGGVDDKRQLAGMNADNKKVLVLDGLCLFGGIEIRSY